MDMSSRFLFFFELRYEVMWSDFCPSFFDFVSLFQYLRIVRVAEEMAWSE